MGRRDVYYKFSKGDVLMDNHAVTSIFTKYPDVVDTEGLCEMLGGISKKLAYRILQLNDIPSIRVGREYRIAKADVIDFVARRTTSHDEQK